MNVISQEQWQRFLSVAMHAGATVMELGTSKACITFGEHTMNIGFSPFVGIHVERGFNYVTLEQGLNLFKALSEWEARALQPDRV